MTRIAFILLCHKDPEAVLAQARRLTATGDAMVIHFDARAPDDAYREIEAGVAALPNVALAPRRVKCGWGEWSLVEATLVSLRAASAQFPDATHFYLISGDCMPIKSAHFAHAMLAPSDRDFIESVNFHSSGWIKTGMREDRLRFRHWFNERKHKRIFYTSLELQRFLGVTRDPPEDIRIHIGSQWWCLRRATVDRILSFVDERPDVARFFRTTWIPDETFFQTIVRHLIPGKEIDSRTLTFLIFTDYGMPATFYNDHYSLLLAQDYIFARKISPGADELKARLATLWESGQETFDISNEGRQLHEFLTGRGRIGRRFAPRFWEREASLGRDRELLIIACKKWHIAKRVLGLARHSFDLRSVDYLFNETEAQLPDLGGIERSVEKRTRHRRALLRLLFDQMDTDRLAICLDPSGIDLMRDFYSDKARTRMLLIGCDFTDEYLIGHARRLGIAGSRVSEQTANLLLPALHQQVVAEEDRIREAGFGDVYTIEERETVEVNAGVLAEFFRIPWEQAHAIAAHSELFSD